MKPCRTFYLQRQIFEYIRGRFLWIDVVWYSSPLLSAMPQNKEARALSTLALAKVRLQPGMALGFKIQCLYQKAVNTDGRPFRTYSQTHTHTHTRWVLSTHEIIRGTRMLRRGPLGNVIYRYLSDHTAVWFIAWGPMSRKTHKSPPSWAN